MGNRRIFLRVFAAMFGFSLLTIVLFSYLYSLQQERLIREVMQTQARTVSRSIEMVSADAMVMNDEGIIVENNLNILKKSPNILYIAIDPKHGDAIISTKRRWQVAPLPPSLKAMESQKRIFGTLLSPLLHETEVFHYVYPLTFNGFDWGWLHLGFSVDQIRAMHREVYRKSLLIGGFMLLLTLVGSYLFSRWLTAPIIQLNEAAKKVASGDLDVTLHTFRHDEMGELIRNFNTMINRLKESQARLRSTNRILEEKVRERTRDLEELNAQLEERVRAELAKSREKDRMLIQQSRLAAMGEMIGNIAHQWRQPLNALGLVLQNIQIAYETGRLDDAFIERATAKGMKLIGTMSHTIDDFRNFFKPNKNKERFDVSDAIRSALELVESSLKNNNIDVRLSIQKGLCALGYPGEFSQVLLNILVNAKDALIESGREPRIITIETRREEGMIVVTVEDNAGGIAEEILEKIFDPYFTTKEEGKGTGLGLYMSKMIIQRSMNGQILAQNGPEGARFSIMIPETEEEEEG